ncbi:MAG: hypothetical protein V3R68_00970, partial [Gammaproteobacteria bacterium]
AAKAGAAITLTVAIKISVLIVFFIFTSFAYCVWIIPEFERLPKPFFLLLTTHLFLSVNLGNALAAVI